MRNRIIIQIALKTMMFGMLGALCANAHASNIDPYVIVGDKLSSEQRHKAEVLLQEASQRLPLSLRSKLPAHILVHWQDVPFVRDAVGMEYRGQITLSPKLLSATANLGVASALHETMHVFEHANPRERVSADPAFLNIAYFNEPILGLTRSGQDLQTGSLARGASPDSYEYHNPKEAFAVNMEHFLLDETFACRRPTLFKYLAQRFGDPFPKRQCEVNHVVPLSSPIDGKTTFVDLDPARLFEVTYIEAGKGQGVESGFGHAMIGLVFCSPKRLQVGPDCRNDEAYHVVISYAASTPPGEMNAWKGLSGKYPVILTFSSLNEIVARYTMQDNRDITMRPLKLSQADQRALLERSIEEFWSYQGRYKFLTRNCATETLRLIRASDLGRKTQELDHPLSPNGLNKKLGHAGWTDKSATTYYAARGAHEELAYQDIRSLAGKNLPRHHEKFLQHTSPAQRALLFDQMIAHASPETASSIALDFIELETRARLNLDEQSQHEIMDSLLSVCQHPSSSDRALCDDIQEFRRLSNSAAPGRSVPATEVYGIPLESELPLGLPTDANSQRLRELQAQLKKSVEAWALSAQLPLYKASLESAEFLHKLDRYLGGQADVSILNNSSDTRQGEDWQPLDH